MDRKTFDHLFRAGGLRAQRTESVILQLNRAVAVAEAQGSAQALTILESLLPPT